MNSLLNRLYHTKEDITRASMVLNTQKKQRGRYLEDMITSVGPHQGSLGRHQGTLFLFRITLNVLSTLCLIN